MHKMKMIRTLFSAFLLLMSTVGWGQTTIFFEGGGGAVPTGWTFNNNVSSNDIDRGSYWLVEDGSPKDEIVTSVYDLSSFTSAEFNIDVATFGSGTANPALIEISFDGGNTFPQSEITNTPSSSTYITGGPITLNSITSQVVIRITSNGVSGRDVRLRNLELTASGTASTPTITENTTSFNGSFGSVNVGSSSASSSFSAEGSDLTADITITAPTGFEVSLNDIDWFSSRTLTQTGGSVSPTTVYVRFTPVSSGAASDNIVLSSTGATDVNIAVSGSGTNPNDADSEVLSPLSQVGSKTITAANITTLGNATDVFAFEIEDQGTADGLNTIVNQVRVVPGANNTADWTDFIQGVRLWNGSAFVTIGSAAISDTEIIIPISSGDLVITDGNAVVLTLYVYLNTSNIIDGEVLDFSIPATGHGFVADASGSGFNPTFTLGAIEGNNITVDVDYSALAFVQQPTNTEVSVAMNPAVTVEAIDVNGNRDTDYDLDINITSTGTLTTSPVTVAAVSGLATFSTLTHTSTGTGLELTASDGLVTDATSGTFDVLSLPTLIITEVADPGDVFTGRFVEIYNYGSSSIDLTAENIHVTVQVNGGTSTNSTSLSGTLDAGGIIVVGNSSNILSNYGFAADVDYGSVNGNGDDSYHLYYGGDHSSGTLLDSYGVLGQDGTSQAWEYENSRAIRNNPTSTAPNTTWTASEWTITSANVADMTPGALENEYRYDGQWKPRDANTNAASSDNILVISSVSTTADWQVGSVEVRTGAILSVSPNNEVEITGNLTNNGSIVLNADNTGYAQLKVNGAVSGAGNATVEQYAATVGWYNMAMPVSGNLDQFGTVNSQVHPNARNIYAWDETNEQWNDIVGNNDGSNVANTAGQGYLVYVGANGVVPSASTIDLTGQMYTSSVINITRNNGIGNNQGWNLIANPFTCALDFSTLTRGNVNNSFAVYDKGAGRYFSYSQSNPDIVSPIVAPMQSFWVRANAANPTINSMTMAANGTVGSTPTFYKNHSVIADRFFLHVFEATDPLKQDEFLLAMIPGTQDANDQEWDAFKRLNDAQMPSLMSVANGDELAINAIDYSPNNIKTKKLQLRFVSSKQNEVYFIELHDSLLTNNYHIELEDLKLRRKHNLNNAAYKFVHDQNAEYRFVLHISPVTTINQGHTHTPFVSGGVNVGINGGVLVLKMDAPAQDVSGALLDLNGRRVMEVEYPAGVEQHLLDVSSLAKGIYLLQLQSASGEEVHKIILP